MKYDFTTNQYVYTRVNGSEYRYEDEFPSIVQNFWTNDPVIWDLEKKITWDELAPSLQELIIRKLKFSDFGTVLQNRILTIESNIANLNNRLSIEIDDRRNGDELLQNQVDSLKRRMSSAESRLTVLENRMDEAERQIELLWIEVRKLWQEIWDIWGSDGKVPAHDITHIWIKIKELEDGLDDVKNAIDDNMKISLFEQINIIWDYNTNSRASDLPGPAYPNRVYIHYSRVSTINAKPDTSLEMEKCIMSGYILLPHSGTIHVNFQTINLIPYGFCTGGTANTELNVQTHSLNNFNKPVTNLVTTAGFIAGSGHTTDQLNRRTNDYGHMGMYFDIPNATAGEVFTFRFEITGYTELHNFNKKDWPNVDADYFVSKINGNCQPGATYYSIPQFFGGMSMT